jgi:hypothetical protein
MKSLLLAVCLLLPAGSASAQCAGGFCGRPVAGVVRGTARVAVAPVRVVQNRPGILVGKPVGSRLFRPFK